LDIEKERQAKAARAYDAFFTPERRDLLNTDPENVRATADKLDFDLAGPSDTVALIDVGNPANPRLRREWERANGKPWPRTEGGQNYHVAHTRAIADGGTNTLDNIRPMHPAEHLVQHMENGDLARWARRAAIARAFGGRVGGLLGPLAWPLDVLGVLSGRIRSDTFDNFAHDLVGQPSWQDQRQKYEDYQRGLDPNWKPGKSASV
jgi:hypothetical protein